MAAFSLKTEYFAEDGYVRVSWTGAPAANHYSYRVYRRPADLSKDWQLVVERTDTAATYIHEDYYSPSNTQQYAVVEVITVNSTQQEEPKVPKTAELYTPYYWLVHPTDKTKHIKLRNVTGDDFANEHEKEIKHLIGRGRKIDVGDDLGVTGSLSGRIYDSADRTARQTRLDIERTKDVASEYYLRNPFGDFWKIWFDDPQWSRISGVGRSEFVDMSFNYYEVA